MIRINQAEYDKRQVISWAFYDWGIFGLADSTEAVRFSFITVAIWWGVFSIVLLFMAGGALLRRVDFKEGVRMAEALE